jgi:hypothetical protein
MSFASLRLLIRVFAISVAPVQPNSPGVPLYREDQQKKDPPAEFNTSALDGVCGGAV